MLGHTIDDDDDDDGGNQQWPNRVELSEHGNNEKERKNEREIEREGNIKDGWPAKVHLSG